MIRHVLGSTIVAAFLGVGPVLAGPCKTAGAADAKEIVIDAAVQDQLRGLEVSFQLGLQPPEFPAEDIKKIAAPCSRGTIQVGANTFEVAGEDTDTPPRYATSASAADTIAYLASMPRPAAAWAWAEKFRADKNTPASFSGPNDMMFTLVLAKGDNRFILAYLDKIPDDARLKQYFLDALTGKLKLQAGFDVKTNTTVPGK